MEIPVLPPDVNESAVTFTPTEDGIRFGLAAIKNVGEGAAQSIVESRIEHGPSTTLFEFCDRLDLRAVNRRVVESLIASGALDTPEGHRAQQLAGLELALKNAQKTQEDRERGQISLFDLGNGVNEIEQLNLPEAEEWTEMEALTRERELLGFYVSSHPLHSYARDLKAFARPLAELPEQGDGMHMRVGGLITRISTLTDRRGQPFAFATLEDLSGKGDVAFFAEAYAAHKELIQPNQAVMVEGQVSERNSRLSINAAQVTPLAQARERLTKAVNLALPYEEVKPNLLIELKQLLERYLGDCELLLHLKNGGEKDAVVRSRTIKVSPCDELLHQVDALIGPKRIWLTAERQVQLKVAQD
jgi:DNA polymerase-3 subunit alpha